MCPLSEVVRDGHYFLAVLDKETQRLLALADKAEHDLEIPDLSEEAKGYLRSAFGKARLLVSQKMQQFRGLCSNNVAQVSEFILSVVILFWLPCSFRFYPNFI